jgi:sugar-specific transcriptional regulator TrmB
LTEETGELLQSIGFSEDQSRIYLRLLSKRDKETIDAVLTGSGLPLDRAEEAIRSLVDKGMLKVSRNELIVTPPRASLAMFLEQERSKKETQLSGIEKTVAEIRNRLEPLYWERTAGVRSGELMQPISDLKEMEVQTANVIANAKESITIFAETFGWYPRIRQALHAALDRGVKAKILMISPDEDSAGIVKELKTLGVDVRFAPSEWYPIRGTLRDNAELVFLIWVSKKDEPRPIHYFPHYTSNAGLIRIFSDAFKQRWQESKPL